MIPLISGAIGLLKGIVELIPWLGQWLKERQARKQADREAADKIEAERRYRENNSRIDAAIATARNADSVHNDETRKAGKADDQTRQR